jgi:hypothetical protein
MKSRLTFILVLGLASFIASACKESSAPTAPALAHVQVADPANHNSNPSHSSESSALIAASHLKVKKSAIKGGLAQSVERYDSISFGINVYVPCCNTFVLVCGLLEVKITPGGTHHAKAVGFEGIDQQDLDNFQNYIGSDPCFANQSDLDSYAQSFGHPLFSYSGSASFIQNAIDDGNGSYVNIEKIRMTNNAGCSFNLRLHFTYLANGNYHVTYDVDCD